MAKILAKNIKSFEEALRDAAIKTRGSVDLAEYRHIVLSLIFLKCISDTFEQQHKKLINSGLPSY